MQPIDLIDKLRRSGELLFGPRWQSDIARLLGVGDRRVREWVSGDRSIPPGVWARLDEAIQRRISDLRSLRDEIGVADER